jgi:8-oxo-dGTP pyrophosphatase MutT (NUDIX family)
MLMKWKTLSSRLLFTDRWFRIRADRCETPGGKIVDPYYVYEFPTWVAAVPLTKDGKIILVRQYRHALGEVSVELPGGCVDDTDKSFEHAIARELAEETGYHFDSYEYLGKISANPSTNNNFLHMYLARDGVKMGEQQLDENEEIEVVILTVDEVKQLIKENRILQAMHVTCLLYAFDKMGVLKL